MASNTEKRITAKMVLDSSGFNSSLKGVNAELKNAQSQMKLASSGIQAFGKDSEKLKSVQEALSKQVELHSKKVGIYTQSIEKTKSKLEDNIKVRDKLKDNLSKAESQLKKVIDTHGKELQGYIKNKEELSKLNKEYETAKKRYGENSTEANKLKEQISKLENEQKKLTAGKEKEIKAYEKAKTEVDKTTKEYEKNEKAIDSNAKKIQQYDTNLNKAQSQMNKAQGELKKINEELDKQNNKWVQASEKLGEHSKKLKDTGQKITDVGKSITTKVSVPLAGLGAIALKTTADYDDSMSQLKAITNSSAEDMGKLDKAAKDMGIQTRYSAKEASDSMVMLGQAGYSTNQILNTTPAVLNLAQAGAIDLTQSTDVLVSSMSQFGIKTENAAHVADVLSLGANKANLGVGDLAESMKYAGAMANTAGWSIEDTTAAIGLMSNYGIKGSQSGTVLRGAISRLVKPSKDAAEKMDELGIKIFDTKGKMKSLPEVLDEVKKGTSNLTEEQKMNTLVTLFGQEAVSGMNALLKEGGNSVRAYSGELKNADGSAAKAAKTMEDNLGGSMRSLKSAAEGAMISMGSALAPTIRDIADKITELTRRFAALSPETQNMIAKFGMFAVVTGPAIVGVGKLATGFGSILSVGSKVTGIIGKITLATKGVEAATATAGVAATSATGAASAGLAGLGSIALPVIGVIAAVGGAVYLAHKNTQYLNDSCVKSAEDMGTMETAMAGLNGHVIHTNKELEEMNVKHKEWSNKVSKDTQKSLDQCANKIADYSMELKNAEKIDNLVDSEAGIRLKTKLDDICNSAIKKIKEKQPELQKTLADGFAADGKIDENEKKILASINKNGQEQIKKVNDIKSKILELEKKAGKQTGEAKKTTLAEVDKLTKEIGNIELKNTVKSKEELMAAQADFNVRMKNLDMNGLSKLMESKAKARDTEVKKIKENYDKQIELLKLNSINVDSETKKAIDIKIGQLETAKNKEIGVENEKYKGYLDAAIEKYPQLINYIDMQHGTMLTKEQQQKQAELLEYGSKMEGFLGITKTGYYKIKDTTTGKMRECYVEVDKSTGQIVGAWDRGTNKIYGNPIKAQEKIDQELKNGQKFKPIGDSYDRVKEGIWKRAIEAQAKTNYNLFNWIHDAHSNAQSWLSNHPFIASVVQNMGAFGNALTVGRKWTGDKYFTGGLTYLHDTPGKNNNYELYDLPRGSRIYNHDASEDLVIKTAESVAAKVANSVLKNFKGLTAGGQDQTIIVPVNLDGREIARVTARPMSEELGKLNRRGGLGYV
ncbi:phage tail tape measure protein [Clostridium botulinum]|nr:phage tail tape measure protein [Clostridium botulinum]